MGGIGIGEYALRPGDPYGGLTALRAAAAPEARSGAPAQAQPVTRAPSAPVSAGIPAYAPALPEVPAGYGPEELANRTKVEYPALFRQSRMAGLENDLARAEGELDAQAREGVGDAESPQEVMEEEECETCARRRYQDGSDDPGVSFKTPTNVDPKLAESAVRSHEKEHVVRERAKAEREGKKVVSQYVTYKTGICPECGRVYMAGGETHTVTAKDPDAENEKERSAPRFEATA